MKYGSGYWNAYSLFETITELCNAFNKLELIHLYRNSFRYQENRAVLREGMTKFGFQEFLDISHTGYIITSYNFPANENFDFKQFYQRLSDKGEHIFHTFIFFHIWTVI